MKIVNRINKLNQNTWLKPYKTYSHLTDNKFGYKKAKDKKSVIKRKLKFKDYKNYLKGAQFENKINQVEKNKVNTEILTENHYEFIKKQQINIKNTAKI